MRSFPRSLFSVCAEILAGYDVSDSENAYRFLQDLGYLDEDADGARESTRDIRINLLRNAVKIDLFNLEVPDSPQMIFIGGRVLPDAFGGYGGFQTSSSSGIGLNLQTAFESCVGEAVEYMSQLSPSSTDEPNTPEGSDNNYLGLHRWSCYHSIQAKSLSAQNWLLGKNLVEGKECWVPEKLCLRQKSDYESRGLSTGCAAGVSLNIATTSAILELVERDAAALWWEGGRSPRPISNEALVDAGVETLFKLAGRSVNSKSTLILDITSDIDIPCVAAISTDAESGGRFSCGLASRVSLSQAIRKAVFEMMQMELSHHLVDIKSRLHGVEALNSQEKAQRKRDESLQDFWNLPIIQTIGQPRLAGDVAIGRCTELQWLLDQLSQLGFDATSVDLSRELFGIPVAKVLIPELQTYPLVSTTIRLDNMIADTGGGAKYKGGVSLL